MTTEQHPPARSARPEIDPRDPPDALRPTEPPIEDPAEDATEDPAEDGVRDDPVREETPRPQASPGS